MDFALARARQGRRRSLGERREWEREEHERGRRIKRAKRQGRGRERSAEDARERSGKSRRARGGELPGGDSGNRWNTTGRETADEKRVQTTSVHFHKYYRSDCLHTPSASERSSSSSSSARPKKKEGNSRRTLQEKRRSRLKIYFVNLPMRIVFSFIN